MVRLRPRNGVWNWLELAWFSRSGVWILAGLVSLDQHLPFGDKSWERTKTVKDNKVHHRSTWKILLLQHQRTSAFATRMGCMSSIVIRFLTVIDPLYHIANKPRG